MGRCADRPPCRTIAALAAAYAREKHDAEFVRRQLPFRIDELLLAEIRCCFDHSLCELIGKAASHAAQGNTAQAALVVRNTLLAAARCAAQALEGLEARLNARSGIALLGDGVEPLDASGRARLLHSFAETLAQGVAAAVPRIMRMATPGGAAALRDEASRQLPCMRESWESVLLCKTQITDLYLDNEELAEERQSKLLGEAVELMETECSPTIDASEIADVTEFLSDAVAACDQDSPLKHRAMCQLAAMLWPSQALDSYELDSTWASVAERVLTSVATCNCEGDGHSKTAQNIVHIATCHLSH